MKLNTIYNEDCLDGMKRIPDGSVDMILCDPPYGINYRSNQRKEKYDHIKNDSSLEWVDEFVDEIYRISRDNTAHYLFTSFHNIDIFKQAIERKFKVKNLLTWVKNNRSMCDLKGDFAPRTEFVIFFHKGRRLINGRRDCNVLEYKKTGNTLHPTQKPVDLVEYLINKFSDEGDVILDPFMGSGTTAIACLNTNRNFIGFELDETYYKLSLERIENHTKRG